MDVLSNVLALLRTKGTLYGRLELSSPFGFEFTGGPGICLIVSRGSCFLAASGRDYPVPLVAGDFVLLPEPQSYSLRSRLDLPVRHIRTVTTLEAFRQSHLIAAGGGGSLTSIIAGGFTFDTPESRWLVKHLPPVLHLSSTRDGTPEWFQATLQFVAMELANNLPGTAAVVDRLAEVLFIQALRLLVQPPYQDERPNWLRALAHPQIAKSMQLMHEAPERSWTVSELASSVSMSRSGFAKQFRELVGTPPSSYLTQWRLVRAANMICSDVLTTSSAVASAVGYESDSAFGKVFRRFMGVSPGRYRQDHCSLMQETSKGDPRG